MTQEEIDQETLAFLKSDEKWPGETCCFKKRPYGAAGYAEHGIVIYPSRGKTIIYLDPDYIKVVVYDTPEAAVADGWMVD